MRATAIAATGFVACLALAGCDNWGDKPTASAPPLQTCNCQPAQIPAVQPPAASRTESRATAERSRVYDESVALADYSSPSRTYYQEGSGDQGETESAAGPEPAQGSVEGDGFGRRQDAALPPVAATPADGARLDPWHGYDKHWEARNR